MRPPFVLHRHAGLTLVELMVSLALGLMVVLAATSLLQQARAAYQDMDDAARVQETGRMALAHLAEALRLAGHAPREAMPQAAGAGRIDIAGLDDSRDAAAFDPEQPGTPPRSGNGYNKSDMLALGYLGAPAASSGAVAHCGGAVPAARPQDETRSWAIYYVAPGIGNEPELRCRYRSQGNAWTSNAIARGVEAMQLRYGIDTDLDGHADRWLDASQISGGTWQHVRLVRIALLVRGDQRRPAAGTPPHTYRLFASGAASDAWSYTEKDGERRRREVFRATVFLRNAGDAP